MKRLLSYDEFEDVYNKHALMLTEIREKFLEDVEDRLIAEWTTIINAYKTRTLKQRLDDFVWGYAKNPSYESFVTESLSRIHNERPSYHGNTVEYEYYVIVEYIVKMLNTAKKASVTVDGYVILGDKTLELFTSISRIHGTIKQPAQEEAK